MSITAYWISPEGENYPVTTTHINFIIDNPKLFGLSSADIETAYDKHQAKSNTDSKSEKVRTLDFKKKNGLNLAGFINLRIL